MSDRPNTPEEFLASYEELVGFVPPRVKARFARAAAAGRDREEVLLAQERVRNRVMYPDCLDQRTVQLVLTGILHSKLSDAAALHGVAARRAGATDEQLQAVIDLAYLFTGMSAANRGPALLEAIDELEAKAR
ncbi:carboxymuconolactone decarboxylase family protein [Streptomyces sp. BH097]|uniref:carboxymuconolactone decarboxylase family protein n=1 Tax=unclassified Streptomyces TaxID=2593676 RepID=UPI003BB524F6